MKPSNPFVFPAVREFALDSEKGMRLRDYFAAAALSAWDGWELEARTAEVCYAMADLMLFERQRGLGPNPRREEELKA